MGKIISIIIILLTMFALFVSGIVVGKYHCMTTSGEASIKCVRVLGVCSFRYAECADALKRYACLVPAMQADEICTEKSSSAVENFLKDWNLSGK